MKNEISDDRLTNLSIIFIDMSKIYFQICSVFFLVEYKIKYVSYNKVTAKNRL